MHVPRHLAMTSAVAVIAAGALGACGGSDAGAEGDVVTITYATPADTSVLDAGERPVIEAFEAANPDVKVEIEQIPIAEYNTKLTTAFRGGQGPDLGRVNHTDIQTFAAGGFLTPLDEVIAANKIDVDALIPGLVEAGRYGDDQMTLPLGTDTRVLFYNPRLLEAQGIGQPPATWDELLADVAAFAGTDAYGYALYSDSDYSLTYETVGPYMVQAGGELLSPEGGKATAVAAQSEGTVAALELVQKIVATGTVPPGLDQFSGNQIVQLFAQDKLAFFTGGPWSRTMIEDLAPDAEYGTDYATAPIPVREEGQQSGSTAGGWQVGVFENSEHKEAAGRLLAYLLQTDNLVALNGSEAFPPVNAGLTGEPYASDEFYAAYAETLPGSALPILPVPRMAEVSAAFENVIEPYLIDPSKPATEGLAAFDEQVNSSILD